MAFFVGYHPSYPTKIASNILKWCASLNTQRLASTPCYTSIDRQDFLRSNQEFIEKSIFFNPTGHTKSKWINIIWLNHVLYASFGLRARQASIQAIMPSASLTK